MWGIIPAAGRTTWQTPLAFAKELLPVGRRTDKGVERTRAIGECILERMLAAGATRVCMVVEPNAVDLVPYFGGGLAPCHLSFVVQPQPLGLCDAIFRALPLIAPEDQVLVGLPDTVWFPEHGLRLLEGGGLSFLCFPVADPQRFDAVVTEGEGDVVAIDVQVEAPRTPWVWGAFRLDGAILRELFILFCQRKRRDQSVGLLVNAWLAQGGRATAVMAGEAYVEVANAATYREAVTLVDSRG